MNGATALVEDGTELIVDGDGSGTYIIGIGPHKPLLARSRLVVAKIDTATGLVSKYAVLMNSIDWTGAPNPPSEDANSHFGSAYTFDQRLFFKANAWSDLFELQLPITVGDCWNEGVVTSAHGQCTGSSSTLKWRMHADVTRNSNTHADSMNCPGPPPAFLAA
jgi:hypothetical protein